MKYSVPHSVVGYTTEVSAVYILELKEVTATSAEAWIRTEFGDFLLLYISVLVGRLTVTLSPALRVFSCLKFKGGTCTVTLALAWTAVMYSWKWGLRWDGMEFCRNDRTNSLPAHPALDGPDRWGKSKETDRKTHQKSTFQVQNCTSQKSVWRKHVKKH